DVPLNNVSVVDENCTKDTSGDDFTIGTIASLALGATVTLTHDGIAKAGQYVNIATATGTDSIGGTVSATDNDRYFGAAPSIQLVKLTNGTDNNSGTGPMLLVGSAVTWTYTVTNTGNVALTNEQIVDDKVTPGTPGDDFTVGTIASLAAGATQTSAAAGTAAAG